MFGTLVVQLPTVMGHEGGTLLVRHQGEQKVFAWQNPGGACGTLNQSGGHTSVTDHTSGARVPVRYAAFYGDCEHELQPITRGVRLCLLYNLVRTTPGPPPVAAVGQAGSPAQLRLSAAVQAWGSSSDTISKVVLPLEHEYTEANLSFGGLKGRDQAMVDVLRMCPELDLHLALVVKHVSGTAEEDYGYCSRYDAGCFPRPCSFITYYRFCHGILQSNAPVKLVVPKAQ